MRLRRRDGGRGRGRGEEPAPPGPRVRLYSRVGCHLCEAAEEVVARVCAEVGEAYEVVDVDADPALRARFDEEVPVTFVDGRQHDFWRVDEVRLRAALGRPRA